MTESSTPLRNARHEAFAQEVAGGASAAEAYRGVYVSAKRPTAETEGPKLLRDPQVSLRVTALQSVAAAVIAKRWEMTREEVAQYLIEIIQTPIGEVNETHRLCQEYSETTGANGTQHRYKMPAKLDAVEKLIKMAGWYAPQKIEHSGGIVGMFEELTGVSNP